MTLTRDMGVNLAGVEVVLNMREKMQAMQKEVEEIIAYVHEHFAFGTKGGSDALVRVPAQKIVRSTTR